MTKQMEFWSGGGSEVNPVKIGGTTTLLGDPAIKPEKPHTIIRFPGGSIELARTQDGDYWVHIEVHEELPTHEIQATGSIVSARIDFDGRYGDEINKALRKEISCGDVDHIAFLIRPTFEAQS